MRVRFFASVFLFLAFLASNAAAQVELDARHSILDTETTPANDPVPPLPIPDPLPNGDPCEDCEEQEEASCLERAQSVHSRCIGEAIDDVEQERCDRALYLEQQWYCPCEDGAINPLTCEDRCARIGNICYLNADFSLRLCLRQANEQEDRTHCRDVHEGNLLHCDQSVAICLNPRLGPQPNQVPDQFAACPTTPRMQRNSRPSPQRPLTIEPMPSGARA